MALDELELMFEEDELAFDAPTNDQLFDMYGCFLRDFHRTPLIHKGKKVIFNTNRSNHPDFRGKYEGFVHVITRKSQYTNRREYDRERANRIHWIKPILDDWQNPLVSYFERLHDDGRLQYFYWVQQLSFLIILRELSPDLLLVTSYCVDRDNIGQFRKYLNEYRGGK